MKNLLNINLFKIQLNWRFRLIKTLVDKNSKIISKKNYSKLVISSYLILVWAIFVNNRDNLVTISTDNTIIIYKTKLGKDNKISLIY